MATATKKVGRPSKFDTINQEQLKKLLLKGFTDKEISDFFNINEDTLNEYKKKYPQFSESLKDWKFQADKKVEESLYHRACGYSYKAVKHFVIEGKIQEKEYIEHYPPDATSMIFWLKNRQPAQWRDKVLEQEDETTKDQELGLVNMPNGDGKVRFAKYLN